MHHFAYARPRSLSEAFALLEEHGSGARVLAGGTDLTVGLRDGTITPEIVVDVKRVAEMSPSIEERDGRLVIGANAVMARVTENATVRALYPALAEAAAKVGSIQIRNRATVAGNICHASPGADTPPVLLVYGADVVIASRAGGRRVALDGFFAGPGQTVLQPGELVTAIELPPGTERRGVSFMRLTRRRGVDLATVNVCCGVMESGRTLLACGAVGPRPFMVADESGVLADPAATDAAKDEVLRPLLTAAAPISDVRASRDYREAMLLVLSRRALRTSIERLAATA